MAEAIDSHFSASYAEARSKFLAAVRERSIPVESLVHPEKGRDGEELAMDVAREGDPNAQRVLILSSGCHGVEGYCGSGVQLATLHDEEPRRRAREAGVALLYIHALNPYGFSHVRRVTHENVDINRNFHDFSRPLPRNPAYAEIHPWLVPAQWPPTQENEAALMKFVAERGQAAYQAAVSGGQHEFPDGLFFGGTAPTWSNRQLREVLRAHGRRAARIAWIDIHTGLGPSGVGERIYAGVDDAATVARARKWWDGGGRTPVTSIFDGSSTSAFLTGLMWNSVYDECPQSEYTGIAMEYGTVPVMQTVNALRAEQWLHTHPGAPPEIARQIKQQMMDAFYTDTHEWKEAVLVQAREALLQAIEGLAA
ncbi:M14 family metallopeptidase [Ramlibacter albus]|uniref:DUF2817 domain-containing protein n=1 Tax=Ramlibacter albus TaxID=2079448 RepID=A0A923S2I0_9BURK|nr:M14 family metallopeptidase [Ramlibacter albus]MBC5764783.1 DUF2817 domain-containing protein [Ramlibacter albus]